MTFSLPTASTQRIHSSVALISAATPLRPSRRYAFAASARPDALQVLRQRETWGTSIGMFALGLLVVTLVTAVYDAHLQSKARIQALHLEQANAKLQHQATHDALTGLPNRLLFIDRLGREIAHAERDGHVFAVLAVDLDRSHAPIIFLKEFLSGRVAKQNLAVRAPRRFLSWRPQRRFSARPE